MESENYSPKSGFLINFVAIFILFSLVLGYFAAINSVVERNFKLLALQKITKEKQSRNQELQNLTLQNFSLKGLSERAKNLNLVNAGKVTYIKVSQDYFALAKTR